MSLTSHQKAALALDLIEEHFGDITKDVATLIVNNENAILADIIKYFKEDVDEKMKLKSSQVREALLILQQHNCLTVSLPPELDPGLEIPQTEKLKHRGLIYSINVDMVINRLRFPKLLRITKKHFGTIGVIIMEELILHGRLRIAQIKGDVTTHIRTLIESNNEEIQSCITYDEIQNLKLLEDKIQKVFERMVQRRLIVTVSTLELQKKSNKFNEHSEYEKSTDAKGKKRKGATTTSTSTTVTKRKRVEVSQDIPTQDLPVELRLMMALQATASANGTATATSSSTTTSTSSTSTKTPVVRGGGSESGRGRGRGRGRGSSASAIAMPSSSLDHNENNNSNNDGVVDTTATDANSTDFGPRDDVLWTLGWEQFCREERHEICSSLAHQRMEAVAGAIVTIMLETSMPTEIGLVQTHSVPVSFMAIFEKLKSRTTMSVDIATLRKLMELMRCDAACMIAKVPNSEEINGGPLYMVNMASIIQLLKKRTIHSIICEKFGLQTGRIFELLLKKKYLDQQKIADLAILPAREARERLYKLYANKWVNYVEVSKRIDFQSNSTLFFWYIDLLKMNHNLLESMYKSLYNIRKRRKFEFEQGKELVEFANQITNVTEADRFDKLARSLDRLDRAVLKVDETIMMLDKL
eukprot:gene10948-22864_t